MGSACCCFVESETWREDVTFQTETNEFNEATPSYTTTLTSGTHVHTNTGERFSRNTKYDDTDVHTSF